VNLINHSFKKNEKLSFLYRNELFAVAQLGRMLTVLASNFRKRSQVSKQAGVCILEYTTNVRMVATATTTAVAEVASSTHAKHPFCCVKALKTQPLGLAESSKSQLYSAQVSTEYSVALKVSGS